MHTNIYPTIVHDLHPKVRQYIDHLNSEGQIDLDKQGYPFVLEVLPKGKTYQVKMVRNNQVEGFAINPRKRKADPINTWNSDDGYVRPSQKKQVIDLSDPNDAKRTERKKRPAYETFENLVTNILEE